MIRNYKSSGHPKEFNQYLSDLQKYDLSIIDIIKHPMRILGVQNMLILLLVMKNMHTDYMMTIV